MRLRIILINNRDFVMYIKIIYLLKLVVIKFLRRKVWYIEKIDFEYLSYIDWKF